MAGIYLHRAHKKIHDDAFEPLFLQQQNNCLDLLHMKHPNMGRASRIFAVMRRPRTLLHSVNFATNIVRRVVSQVFQKGRLGSIHLFCTFPYICNEDDVMKKKPKRDEICWFPLMLEQT